MFVIRRLPLCALKNHKTSENIKKLQQSTHIQYKFKYVKLNQTSSRNAPISFNIEVYHMYSNSKNNNSPPLLSCCSSQGFRGSQICTQECAIQCSSSYNKTHSSVDDLETFRVDPEDNQDFSPMKKMQMSQDEMESCSECCNYNNTQQPSLATLDKRSIMKSGKDRPSYSDPRQNSKETSTAPCNKKDCDLCCKRNEAAQKISQLISSISNQTPCDDTNCTFSQNIQKGVPEVSQQMDDSKKSPCDHHTPTRPVCSIASETSQKMLATLPKKMDKDKKRKGSKTSLRSNKSARCEMCAYEEGIEEGCTCHFPPAFSEFFQCTGDITGTCYCYENKN